MLSVTRRLTLNAAAAGAIALLSLSSAAAQTPAEFFSGKRINLITASAAGGGYDQYARLVAKHMREHVPGKPTIVVQNMTGAAGLRAANHLYNLPVQDGTTIGALTRNIGLAGFYDVNSASIQFDARKFFWLGSPQQEVGVLVVSTKGGLKSFKDLVGRDITSSSTARNSPSSIYPRIMNAVMGTRIKVIEGYEGSQSALLAVERGEVDANVVGGTSAAFRATITPWLQAGNAKVMLQLGMTTDENFADAPSAFDLAKSPDDKQLLEIAFAEQVMGRPFLIPPQVPADRVKALRDAFDATMKDPEFLQEAKQQRIQIAPVSGQAIHELLDRIYSAPDQLTDQIRKIVK